MHQKVVCILPVPNPPTFTAQTSKHCRKFFLWKLPISILIKAFEGQFQLICSVCVEVQSFQPNGFHGPSSRWANSHRVSFRKPFHCRPLHNECPLQHQCGLLGCHHQIWSTALDHPFWNLNLSISSRLPTFDMVWVCDWCLQRFHRFTLIFLLSNPLLNNRK